MAALAFARRRYSDRGDPLGFALLEVLEEQLELGDLQGQLLRRSTEAHPPQDGKLCFQLFDEELGTGQLSLRDRQLGPQPGDFLRGGYGTRHGTDTTPSAAPLR